MVLNILLIIALIVSGILMLNFADGVGELFYKIFILPIKKIFK